MTYNEIASLPGDDPRKIFYVFTSEERAEQGIWTQFCYNIDYLNGWLYGCVQGAMGCIKFTEKRKSELNG